jgi:hypothetical protein
VFERFKGFKACREDLEDNPSSGRPSTSQNADTIEIIRETVIRDCQWALRMMADELNNSKEMIHQLFHEDLRKGMIFTEFIPHRLTDKKKQRLASCQDFIQTCHDVPSFLSAFFSFLR